MVVFQTAKLRRGVPDVPRDQANCREPPDYHDFTTSSVFRAPDQLPTRSALVTPNWRGCERQGPPEECVQRRAGSGFGSSRRSGEANLATSLAGSRGRRIGASTPNTFEQTGAVRSQIGLPHPPDVTAMLAISIGLRQVGSAGGAGRRVGISDRFRIKQRSLERLDGADVRLCGTFFHRHTDLGNR